MRSVWILLHLLYAKPKVNSQARMLNSSVIATFIDLNNIILSQSQIASFDSDLNSIYLICLSSKQHSFMFYFLELFKQCWEVCVYFLQKPFTHCLFTFSPVLTSTFDSIFEYLLRNLIPDNTLRKPPAM